MLVFICVFVIIIIIIQILWNAKTSPKTEIYHSGESNIIKKIIDGCSIIHESYKPTYIWGRSGHFQSLVFSIANRFGSIPEYISAQHSIIAPDGSLVTYRLTQPSYIQKNSVTIVVVPGICNHSENKYIKVFAQHMNQHGYKVAVLNHTGALKNVPLTRPRIFTYGYTDDLDLVVSDLIVKNPGEKLIGIGFSLGANVLMKYLGEKPERQLNFLFAASLCQGYNLPECITVMSEWDNLRRLYYFGLTRNMLKVISYHKDKFESHSIKNNIPLDWKRISSAKALHELDHHFTAKVYGDISDMAAFYRSNSSSTYMKNIFIPTLVLNAKDDPLIPESLFKYPRSLCDTNPNVVFVVTPYGGHLGFFEGGYIIPNRLSWLDRMLLEFTNVALDVVIKNDVLEPKEVVFEC
ncbi:monoacylglycerol lipase ABHD2 isoform X1 [Hydra vulgaris]|uniref:monoacylglycerol lipase ABHD2 isoform X1 n=1 Tax=Hydra vulgaris TaxID=6087 RepID=UPI001F5F70C6|nr:monoacylglycerol lipase ABHD2 isoform X1 [Hydra vulgaris]